MNTLNHMIALFFIGTLAHVALRLYIKVRAARKRTRGAVHQPGLFGQMVAWYFVFLGAAFIEWKLALWTLYWPVTYLGAFLTLLSLVMQYRSFHDLGEAYSPDIEVRGEQRLVQTGVYNWVRHPLLTSLLLEVWGLTLFANAYITTFLVGLIYVPIVLHRKREEEKILEKHFGAAYKAYGQRVGAFFPKWAR